MCDKRVAVEAQPERATAWYRASIPCQGGGWSDAIVRNVCQVVTTHYERNDGVRYANIVDDCGLDVWMRGPCR